MGYSCLQDACRPLLPRRNLAVGEESVGQTDGWTILTAVVILHRNGIEARSSKFKCRASDELEVASLPR
jgi:hypothetical protein